MGEDLTQLAELADSYAASKEFTEAVQAVEEYLSTFVRKLLATAYKQGHEDGYHKGVADGREYYA